MTMMRLAVVLTGFCRVVAGDVVITPLQDETLANLPSVPWVADGDRGWIDADPLFTLSDNSTGTSAKGWVAASDRKIFLRVIVKDDTHVNDKTEGAIWEGDCIQVGLDAIGNGKTDIPMDDNDAAMAFALTSKGVTAWAYHHGRPGGRGAMPQIQTSIVRNDETGTTTYDIALPWMEFQTQPGLSPVLGIAVQINDTDQGAEQTRLYFGQGAGGKPRPGSFRKLRLGTPPFAVLAARVEQENLWRTGDPGEILLAVGGQNDVTVRVTMGEAREELTLPATTANAGVTRLKIHGTPRPLPSSPLPSSPLPMEVSVVDVDGNVLLSRTATMKVGGRVFENLNQRIDDLAAESTHPLFTRHLRSVQAVANIEWQLAQWELDDSTHLAENAAGFARQILEGLNGDAAVWDSYPQRRRKLVLGFMAPSDRSLRYYMVTLPKEWDPEKTYPMIVFLHGAGTSHVASEVIGSLFDRHERQPPEARFDGDPDTLYIEPYGRGRHGYHGIVERDVLLAVDDAARTFNVDPDRIYLTGFSMGGAGTWTMAAHSPDRWAAVCINAGGPRHVPTGIGIGRNFIGLPVRIWHGEADQAIRVENAIAMAEELRAYGVEPDLIIAPGVSHDYYGQPQESESLAWLTTHTRTRPNHFGFTAETGEYLGRNGVTLERDPAMSLNPWFECRIDGNIVRLTTEGTPALTVQLGGGGLGFTDDVKVFHGTRNVYEGPAVTIRINTADGAVMQAGQSADRRR